MQKIKYWFAKFLGYFLSTPIIPKKKTVGYSLVKSQCYRAEITQKTKLNFPLYLHNVSIGDYTYIAKNSNITNTIIGKFCSIGPNFCSGFGIHPTGGVSTSPMFYSTAKQNGHTLVKQNKFKEYETITIGNDVFIGANVTVLDGVTIGNGAIIGAGAVVVKNIPDYAIAVGVPAKVVKYRFNFEQIKKLKEVNWWNLSSDKLYLVEKHFNNIDDFIDEIAEK